MGDTSVTSSMLGPFFFMGSLADEPPGAVGVRPCSAQRSEPLTGADRSELTAEGERRGESSATGGPSIPALSHTRQ